MTTKAKYECLVCQPINLLGYDTENQMCQNHLPANQNT